MIGRTAITVIRECTSTIVTGSISTKIFITCDSFDVIAVISEVFYHLLHKYKKLTFDFSVHCHSDTSWKSRYCTKPESEPNHKILRESRSLEWIINKFSDWFFTHYWHSCFSLLSLQRRRVIQLCRRRPKAVTVGYYRIGNHLTEKISNLSIFSLRQKKDSRIAKKVRDEHLAPRAAPGAIIVKAWKLAIVATM